MSIRKFHLENMDERKLVSEIIRIFERLFECKIILEFTKDIKNEGELCITIREDKEKRDVYVKESLHDAPFR